MRALKANDMRHLATAHELGPRGADEEGGGTKRYRVRFSELKARGLPETEFGKVFCVQASRLFCLRRRLCHPF